MDNPFRPSAGATPPEILGRNGVLDEFEYGLRLGSGAPGLLTIFTGEIHAADRNELAQLAASVQHFIQDRLPTGLVFAGLPAAVSDLLNEGVATVLHRADKIDLHAAAVMEVENSYAATFARAEIGLSPDLVRRAAEATGGYPFPDPIRRLLPMA